MDWALLLFSEDDGWRYWRMGFLVPKVLRMVCELQLGRSVRFTACFVGPFSGLLHVAEVWVSMVRYLALMSSSSLGSWMQDGGRLQRGTRSSRGQNCSGPFSAPIKRVHPVGCVTLDGTRRTLRIQYSVRSTTPELRGAVKLDRCNADRSLSRMTRSTRKNLFSVHSLY
jgi:hypothetical protein